MKAAGDVAVQFGACPTAAGIVIRPFLSRATTVSTLGVAREIAGRMRAAE